MSKLINEQSDDSENHSLIWKDITIETLTESIITQHTDGVISFDPQSYQHIVPNEIDLNEGIFTNQYQTVAFPSVTVKQGVTGLHLSCACYAEKGKLCEHQAQVLTAIINRREFRIFFDEQLRYENLKKFAIDYGLENEYGLDQYFQLNYSKKKVVIIPRSPSLIPVTKDSLRILQDTVLPATTGIPKHIDESEQNVVFAVLKQHKYYGYLVIELYKAQTTKDGKIKNPLTLVPPLDMIWETEDHREVKFFTGIHRFQSHSNTKKNESDLLALRAIVKNPLRYDFYYHNSEVSENVTAASVLPIKVSTLPQDLTLTVNPREQFYELSGNIKIGKVSYPLKELATKFTYFILAGDTLFLVDNMQVLGVMAILKNKPDNLLIHASKFQEFKAQLLTKLEDRVHIEYQHIKQATPLQLEQQGFTEETERIIYLSDFGVHVMIIPVIRYGDAEVPIRTKRQIHGVDKKGNDFTVKRDYDAEDAFTAILLRQHPYFDEQLDNDLHYYYLHKKRFLEEDWFLNTFEEWKNQGITVLGFNEIEGNKLNPNKVKITIKVLSGINWFNTLINVRFGKKKAALKQVQKAIQNKSKYIQLDDGTLGILPADWIEKFTGYFNSGEIAEADTIRTPKINFPAIEQFYEQELLADEVKTEIGLYRKKLAGFESIQQISAPAELNATLREYQLQGLSWLNFLDDFNFGGCLADDMGLGKSIQIIAFILSQRSKVAHNVNLLVVPTSLIFNWQSEVDKFAPSIKVHTIYGADRIKNIHAFEQYELIITSYGTLLADISFLKDYEFNYVFLDESQHIKNPESQRYKTVRLLKSRNKIVITGTPIENNTFDLYGQLSFACPGLLGSKQYFKDIYSTPIDQFKNSKRALELQNKIKPFILRRTKQEVATELPEKIEMVLYCEMQAEQRKIYDAYEREFRDYIAATSGDELAKSPMNVLKGLTKLRQICNSPMLLSGEKLPGEASAKIDVLMEEITGKMGQHKILVFSQFVGMLDLIKKELVKRGISFTYLTGSTRNRESVVNEFQGNPQVRIFLISLKAGGTGLNLTEADYVYLVDPWWNPAVENQAIDRSHRIGQDKNIVAVRLICPGTVEEKIMKVQESKRQLVGELIQSNTSFISTLSKKELLGLLE